MEIGILVAAAVAVAAVAAYFYISSVKKSAEDVGTTAKEAVGKMKSGAETYTTKIEGLFEESTGEGTNQEGTTQEGTTQEGNE